MSTLNDIRLYISGLGVAAADENPFPKIKEWKKQGGSVEEAAKEIETTLKAAGVDGKIDQPAEISYFSDKANITRLLQIIDGKANRTPLALPTKLEEAQKQVKTLLTKKGHEGEGLLEYLELCETSTNPIIKAFAQNVRDNLPRAVYGDANTKLEFKRVKGAAPYLQSVAAAFGEETFRIDPNLLDPIPAAKFILLQNHLAQYLKGTITDAALKAKITELKFGLSAAQNQSLDMAVTYVLLTKDIRMVNGFTEKEILKARIRSALHEHFLEKFKKPKKDREAFYASTISKLIDTGTKNRELKAELQEFYKTSYGVQRTISRRVKETKLEGKMDIAGGALQVAGLPDFSSLAYGAYKSGDFTFRLMKSAFSMLPIRGFKPIPFNPFVPIEEFSDSDKQTIYRRNQYARILGLLPSLNGYQQFITQGPLQTLGLVAPQLIGLTREVGQLGFQRSRAAFAGQVDLKPADQALLGLSTFLGIGEVLRLKETIASNYTTNDSIEQTPDDTALSDLYDPNNPTHFDDVPKVDDAGPFFSTLNWDGWRRLNLDQILALDTMNFTSDVTRLHGRLTGGLTGAGVALVRSLATFLPINRYEIPLGGTAHDDVRDEIFSNPNINRDTFLESLGMQLAGVGGSLLADGDSKIQQAMAEILPRTLTEWQHTHLFAGMASNHDSIPALASMLDGTIAAFGDLKSGVMLGQLASDRLGPSSSSTPWQKGQVGMLMGMQLLKTGLGWASAGIEASKRPEEYRWKIYTAEAAQTAGLLIGLGFGFIGPKGNDRLSLNPEFAPGSLVGGHLGKSKGVTWGLAPTISGAGGGVQLTIAPAKRNLVYNPDQTN